MIKPREINLDEIGEFNKKVFLTIEQGTETFPVTKEVLVARFGVDERTIRRSIAELRKAGVRVCSSSSRAGYWIATNDRQYEALRSEYISRVKDLMQTVRAMDGFDNSQFELEVMQ